MSEAEILWETSGSHIQRERLDWDVKKPASKVADSQEESKPLMQANKPARPKILFCDMTFNAFKDRLCPWTSKEIIARQQSPDVGVRKITRTRWRILFVVVFSAVAQIMLCLRKGQCCDTQAKNCRQNGTQCFLLCNMLQCAVKVHTTNEMRNVNFTPISFDSHLKSLEDWSCSCLFYN